MIIGTMRPEEAKVFDSQAGFHPFHDEENLAYGSFEVFWNDGDRNFDEDGQEVKPGWYWWPCLPGHLPDGDPVGPFSTSYDARQDADEFWEG